MLLYLAEREKYNNFLFVYFVAMLSENKKELSLKNNIDFILNYGHLTLEEIGVKKITWGSQNGQVLQILKVDTATFLQSLAKKAAGLN